MIKVSVIVPLHNSKKYLKECMDSIVNQSLQDIEIICIDSGSDETSEIIRSYVSNDKRIKYIYDSNSSYGYKINTGISLSQGKYIGIVESDDYIRSDMMQILYELAEDNNVDFVKSDYKKCIDINSKRVELGVEHFSKQGLCNRVINIKEESQLKEYIGYNIWVGLYRKEFLVSNGIFLNESDGASYQDTGFSILLTLLAQRIYLTDQQLYRYRIDNNNSSVKSQQKYGCIVDEFFWLKEQMNSKGLNGAEEVAFYLDKKLISYFWNFKRLLPEYQNKFLNKINLEIITEFPPDSNYVQMASNQQLKKIKILSGDINSANEFERERINKLQNFENVVKIIDNKNKIVIFGAGMYGEALINFGNILNENKIVAVCDNDIHKYNKQILGLNVGSPKETVSEHKEAFYIIANKKNSQEILMQLVSFGIQTENIYAVKEFSGCPMLLEAISELSISLNSIPKYS